MERSVNGYQYSSLVHNTTAHRQHHPTTHTTTPTHQKRS